MKCLIDQTRRDAFIRRQFMPQRDVPGGQTPFVFAQQNPGGYARLAPAGIVSWLAFFMHRHSSPRKQRPVNQPRQLRQVPLNLATTVRQPAFDGIRLLRIAGQMMLSQGEASLSSSKQNEISLHDLYGSFTGCAYRREQPSCGRSDHFTECRRCSRSLFFRHGRHFHNACTPGVTALLWNGITEAAAAKGSMVRHEFHFTDELCERRRFVVRRRHGRSSRV